MMKRHGGPMVPDRYDAYRRTLDDALDRLPDYPAPGLKRGVTLTPADLARYVLGRIVTEAAFTSGSMDKGFDVTVRFRIKGLHGERIERLSAHPSEREVLLRPVRGAGCRARRRSPLTKGYRHAWSAGAGRPAAKRRSGRWRPRR